MNPHVQLAVSDVMNGKPVIAAARDRQVSRSAVQRALRRADVPPLPLPESPAVARALAAVEGQGLSITEAARRYGVSRSAIHERKRARPPGVKR